MKKSGTFVSFFFFSFLPATVDFVHYDMCRWSFLTSRSVVVLNNCIADILTALCWNRGSLPRGPGPSSTTPSV